MASFRAFTILFTVLVTSMRLLKTDGKINTDPTVATKPAIEVIEGTNVNLPCIYDREVFVVYWYRGARSSVDSLIMYLDVFYGGGERGYGPQSAAGRYNMTDNYSLIMYDVSMEDEGQYLCEVSDKIDGTIYRNYTNVTFIATSKTVVTVTPRLELTIGSTGLIPCSYQRPVSAVTWYSGKLPSPANIIGTLRFDPRHAQTPTWYLTSHRFNITEDFGLQIKTVDVEDEGYYTCQVDDVALNMTFYNNSKVGVQGSIAGRSRARIAVPLVVIPIFGIICFAVYIMQKRKRVTDRNVTASGAETNEQPSESLLDNSELSEVRKTISKYNSASISIQLVGLNPASKWAFMTSVLLSLTEGGCSRFVDLDQNEFERKPIKLSRHIELREHQIITSHGSKRKSGSFRRLSKKEEIIRLIFIASYSNVRGIEEIRKLIQDFAEKPKIKYGCSMKLVIIPDEFAENLDDAKPEISSKTGVHLHDIYVVDNHRSNKQLNVKTSISLLNIIKDCLL